MCEILHKPWPVSMIEGRLSVSKHMVAIFGTRFEVGVSQGMGHPPGWNRTSKDPLRSHGLDLDQIQSLHKWWFMFHSSLSGTIFDPVYSRVGQKISNGPRVGKKGNGPSSRGSEKNKWWSESRTRKNDGLRIGRLKRICLSKISTNYNVKADSN